MPRLPRPATQGDSRDFPQPRMVEGQPFEIRPPEKADDKPLFPEQTRAPYHKVAGYKVTTITDKLHLPWSLAFLPDGKMLVTEKFPAPYRASSVPTARCQSRSPALTGLAVAQEIWDCWMWCWRRISIKAIASISPSSRSCRKATATPIWRMAFWMKLATRMHDVTVIYRGVPELPEHNFSMKQGGRIAFAKDGSLFMTVGDRDGNRKADYDQQLAQKLDNDLGKIIHLTQDGSPRPTIPFSTSPACAPKSGPMASAAPKDLPSPPTAPCGRPNTARAAATS